MGFFEIFSGLLVAFYGVIPSYGIAIILLTIVVRLVLVPLSIKQIRSQRELQRLQPEVKRIQAKFKGDRQKMNEAMMALYKEHGVNPFGGCLPLLLQMPVFIALYRVLYTPLAYLTPFEGSSLATALREMPVELNRFLGIQLNCTPANVMSPPGGEALAELSEAQRVLVESCPGGGLMAAFPYLVLVALMGLSMYVQQKQMQSQMTTDPAARQAQTLMKIMPLFLMVVSYNFPAGLTMYWTVSNLWTIGQQHLMLQLMPPVPTGSAAKGSKAGKTAADGSKPGAPATKGSKAGKTAAEGTKPRGSSAKANKKKK